MTHLTNKPNLSLAAPLPLPSSIQYAIEDFLHAKATRAAKTIAFYELGLRLYADHVGEHWPPSESSINSFLADCKSRGCSDGTLHCYYRALRAWLNWLHKRGKVESNPIHLVDEPPKTRQLPRAPKAKHLQSLFETLELAARLGKWTHIRDLALFGLMYDTGSRVSEIAKLEMPDLTVPHRTATIREAKTHEDRTVYFEDRTAEDLQRWIKLRESLVPPNLTAVFTSKHRQHHGAGQLSPDGIRRALRGWCARARVPRITPHQLRHAYAIHTLRAGGDILDVQKQLGHRDISTTMTYLRVADAGRQQRHAKHSPRKNLQRAVAEETEFLPPD